jgi:hypothetical protein
MKCVRLVRRYDLICFLTFDEKLPPPTSSIGTVSNERPGGRRRLWRRFKKGTGGSLLQSAARRRGVRAGGSRSTLAIHPNVDVVQDIR